jgi:drug/metabolite transporter (DMT)-like permease
MIGLVPDTGNFIRFEFTLVLFNLVAAALCLCIGAMFSSAAVANLLASLTMLFSMLFAGFLLNKGTRD